jgi:lactose/L-arabinose transport system permease protein
VTNTKKKVTNSSAIQKRLIPSYIFLIIVCFISVFPIYWMLTAATNASFEVSTGKIWFGTHAIENFKGLLTASIGSGAALSKVMWNSFKYSAVQTVLCIFVCSLAGYGFELYHDEKKDKLFAVLLLAMMIPGVATLIPLFRMMSAFHLLSTVAAFILPGISTPFMIMMFRQNSRNFPVDIMEAARIDGLSEFAIFFRMYMPIMKSTYAAAAVITFMNAWNAYMWPRAVLSDNKAMTMQMLVANLSNGYSVDYGVLMMGVLFCSLPTMIIFFVLQKQFAEGITGAVK